MQTNTRPLPGSPVTVPASARRRPPGRYDEPSLVGQRVLAVLLAVVFFGLLAAIVVTLFGRFGQPEVRFRVLGFTVESDTTVRIDFEVTKEPGQTAYCAVRARDASGAETGREVVTIGPARDGAERVRLEHRLATAERAVTGEVERCSLQGPRSGGGAP